MAELWEGVYCVCVVFVMFVALLRNVAGPDVLMLGALAMVLAAGIVDIPEGLKGFSNKGSIFGKFGILRTLRLLDFTISISCAEFSTPITTPSIKRQFLIKHKQPSSGVRAFLFNQLCHSFQILLN